MLPRHAPERALNVLQSITRQLTLVLILDLNSHCSSVSQPDDYAQQRLSTLREVSVLRQTDCFYVGKQMIRSACAFCLISALTALQDRADHGPREESTRPYLQRDTESRNRLR